METNKQISSCGDVLMASAAENHLSILLFAYPKFESHFWRFTVTESLSTCKFTECEMMQGLKSET